MIEVVAALIFKDDKVLIAKRTYGDGPAIGKWEFPGGKINEGETEVEALKRELREELNIEVDVKEFLADHIEELPTRTIHLKLYKCIYISGDILINNEHTDYKLVDINSLGLCDLVPADRKLFENIKDDVIVL